MAIQYKLTNTNTTNKDSTRLYLKNDSIFTLPDKRSDRALIIVGVNKTSRGDKTAIIEDHNPITDDKYTADITVDGWYRFSIASLPIYENATSYLQGDVYYSTSDEQVVIINQDTSTYTTQPRTSLAGSLYVVNTVDVLLIPNSTKLLLRLNTLINDLITNNVDFIDKRITRLKDNYNIVRLLIQGSLYEFAIGNKAVAQKNIEFLLTNDYLTDITNI